MKPSAYQGDIMLRSSSNLLLLLLFAGLVFGLSACDDAAGASHLVDVGDLSGDGAGDIEPDSQELDQSEDSDLSDQVELVDQDLVDDQVELSDQVDLSDQVELSDQVDTLDTLDPDQGEVEDVDTVEVVDPIACDSDFDCVGGLVCVFVFDAPTTTYCAEPLGPTAPGGACVAHEDCANGACLEGVCVAPCSLEQGCGEDFECESQVLEGQSEWVCIALPTACASDESCTDEGLACIFDPSDAEYPFSCGESVGSGSLGDLCSDHADCASNLCVDGVCTSPCERNNDCSEDGSWICEAGTVVTDSGSLTVNLCQVAPPSSCTSDNNCSLPERCVAVHTPTEVNFVCGSANVGGESGVSCSNHSDCAANLCLDGVCAGPCQAAAHCPDEFSCNIESVDLSGGGTDQVSVCMPPIPCLDGDACLVSEVCYVEREQNALASFCGDSNIGGHGQGVACSEDLDCAANLCYEGRFNSYCTELCNNNNDCITGYECVVADVEVLSGAMVSAQLCRALPPDPCDEISDCSTGTTCGIVVNEALTALESVCIPNTGLGNGAACSVNEDCRSNVCLEGVCTVPCTSDSQCLGQQLCLDNTVFVDSLTGQFDLCQYLEPLQCGSSGDCTDGVRVCGELSSTSTELLTWCTFPNDGQLTMGNACSDMSDCYDNVCGYASGECTVFCEADSDCGAAADHICTAYRYNPGPTDLGMCARSCTDSDDCQVTGSNPDAVCSINANFVENIYDLVCEAPAGDGDVGAPCTNSSGNQDGNMCETGICLRTYLYDGTPCTVDSQCASGSTCEALLDGSGSSQCATTSDACTAICDDNGDCTGSSYSGNELTVCEPGASIGLPNGGGAQTLTTCSRP